MSSKYQANNFILSGPPPTPKAGENGDITNHIPKDVSTTEKTNSLTKKTTAAVPEDDFTR